MCEFIKIYCVDSGKLRLCFSGTFTECLCFIALHFSDQDTFDYNPDLRTFCITTKEV